MFGVSRFVRYFILLYAVYTGINYFLQWKSYTFSPTVFRKIAQDARTGRSGAQAAAFFSNELLRKYPQSVVPFSKSVGLSAGGLQLNVQMLHLSLFEYVAMFSAPFATTGRSGLHWSNSSCTVLSGTVERYSDATTDAAREKFTGGVNFRHSQFHSYIYQFSEDTYLVCYGRGLIPLWTTLGAISTGNPVFLYQQLAHFAEIYFYNAIRGIQSTFNYYKETAQRSMRTDL